MAPRDFAARWNQMQLHSALLETHYEKNLDKAKRKLMYMNALPKLYNQRFIAQGKKFKQTWLARYPKPTRCIHDMGGEFVGWNFQALLSKLHIKDAQSTSKNPQSTLQNENVSTLDLCENSHFYKLNISFLTNSMSK